jgi:glutamate:GABA antiporter
MKNRRSISLFFLTMINLAAILNIKNFPLSALYGLSSVFFFILAALIYFIPVSLVSAELASGWPHRGIYEWVKTAFGQRLGFLAIWLQWVENVIWYPTVLSFIAGSFAYIINPALAENKLYIVSVILLVFWLVTLVNFSGMKTSSWISTFCVATGTLLPSFLIIAMGLYWYGSGHPSQTPLSASAFFPNLTSLNSIVIFSGVLLSLAGMEMSAVHASEVENPKKNYPKAIFLSAFLILFFYSLGSLAVAIVVPFDQINLASGAMAAFSFFLTNFNMKWAIPVIACLMGVGAFGTMSTWVVGPPKGLLASAQDGNLPPLFQKTNRKGMPVVLLLLQALFVSLLCFAFLFMPNVSSSYWILINLTVELYLVMYMLLFLSGIALRYKKPNVHRAYTVPGKYGMWIVSLVGLLSSIGVFIIGLFPPSQIDTGNFWTYESLLIGGIVIFLVLPLIIYQCKKESWKSTAKASTPE